ncbi:MAG: hypothetical protein EPN37_07155 [Chitinophagaceae bacterium]|nr:MAG: hypothetical protein EPN37_07155 [Chitinophagaceae bacterium]
MQEYIFSKKLFNPLFWILLKAINNEKIRYIFIFGGSSAAKTYTIAQLLTYQALKERHSAIILRKFSVDIEDSVWADFREINEKLRLKQVTTTIKRHIRYLNGAQQRFRGLDQAERLKGLKGFMYLYYNELSMFGYDDFRQGRKRLRGMAGQKIIADWNPISDQHFIKKDVIDNETWTDVSHNLDVTNSFVRVNASGNMLLIKTTFKDNFWVVGRPGGGGFVDQHVLDDYEYDRVHHYNDYRIYALGEYGRLRTGGEFWKSFNESQHVRVLSYDDKNSLHVSLDNNVQPYVTCSVWQIDTSEKKIKQTHEIAAKSPDNNAPRAARLLVTYLKKIEYKDVLFVYGDPSASARSTIDADSASFYDKYLAELRAAGFAIRNRVQRSAPEVARSGDFINEIYANNYGGWSIEIDQRCRISIDDYCEAKEDKDGKILKKRVTDKETGTSYEEHGHFSDAKRYFITTILAAEFKKFKSTRSKYKITYS